MKKAFMVAIGMVAALLIVACGEGRENIKKDMVQLDRTYIPILMRSKSVATEDTVALFTAFKNAWGNFYKTYYNATEGDEKWKSDLDILAKAVANAEAALTVGESALPAHEELEQVREIFYTLRKRNNISYYLDPLTEFHTAMEVTIDVAETLTMTNEQDPFETLLPYAQKEQEILRHIATNEFDQALFGFSDDKVTALNRNIKGCGANVDALITLIEQKKLPEAKQMAGNIKGKYKEIYMLFGDFSQ